MNKYDNIEIKKDCFAYKKPLDERKYGTCNALTELFCKEEICNFFDVSQRLPHPVNKAATITKPKNIDKNFEELPPRPPAINFLYTNNAKKINPSIAIV